MKIEKMKISNLLLGVAFLSLVFGACKNEPEIKTVAFETTEAKKEISADAVLAKAEFTIEGMTCAMGCAKTIEKKLSSMEGVKSATVDFDKKLAMVEFDEATISTSSLEETVQNAGESYSVSEMKTVESFTTNFAKKECSKDCKKENCDHKEDKASSDANVAGDKKACNEDCKKACCAKKA